ncbi:MAG: hypothetical protein WC343_07540 [Bacilli bacterium]|jgi:hypothetical protein
MTAENIALAIWYAFLAGVVAFLYLLAIVIVDAATLSMTGSCAGQGFTNISVEADLLIAAINQTANGTSWQIWGAPV